MTRESKIHSFVKELEGFAHTLSCLDREWDLVFPGQDGKWRHMHVTQYKKTFYVGDVDGDCGVLEVEPGKGIWPTDPMGSSRRHELAVDPRLASKWESLMGSARRWLNVVARDWIKANMRVWEGYPLNRRYGIVPNSVVSASLPDIYHVDRELGKMRTRKFVRLVEAGLFMREENTVRDSMSAADYFEYCRIAYIAAERKEEHVDRSLSGREMYSRYADGRHEGLLDIDETSEQEFADWIDRKHPKRTGGGHPWEIKRGGNTTHIDLYVIRPEYARKEGFKVVLHGPAIGRLVETIRMFLAIHAAGLPISIAEPEGVRKRLLAQDNIGIVPCYRWLHRANQHFGKDGDVYDVMHYDDLGRFKRRITPFIVWEPLPILKPR